MDMVYKVCDLPVPPPLLGHGATFQVTFFVNPEYPIASLILCSTPIRGHITPMLAVAAGLVRRGHSVRFLTGSRYRDQVTATGAEFAALPAEADYDDTQLDAAFPGRVGLKGPAGIRYDIQEIFVRPGRFQFAALQTLIENGPADAVIGAHCAALPGGLRC